MTDKQIEKLAESMATRVMELLVKKQQEWDADFEKQMENSNWKAKGVNPDGLEEELDALRALRLKYIEDEKYELVPKINDQIESIQKRLNDR
jgi:hypothetical protein